jgi:hypothetical protein
MRPSAHVPKVTTRDLRASLRGTSRNPSFRSHGGPSHVTDDSDATLAATSCFK